MYYVISQHSGARLHYVCQVLFKDLLGVDFQLIDSVDAIPKGEPFLAYTHQSPQQARYHINPCGLLADEFGLEPCANPDEQGIAGDPLAAIFWWITGFPYQSEPCYDKHGRYDFAQYAHIQAGQHHAPQVYHFANLIREKMGIPKHPMKKPTGTVTIDVDQPWLFKHKPLGIQIGSIGKHLLKGDIQGAWRHFQTMLGGKDPNDTFDTIFQHTAPKYTRFFCLLERRHPNDTRHTWRNPAMNTLIRRIQAKGYGLGIHPSYTCYLRPDFIQEEIDHLTQITKTDTTHNRMHFLRYRQPETLRALISSGIRHDYSTGLYHDTGFVYGVAQPFPWFDLEQNEATELMLHPTIAMDRTLVDYLKLSPKEALGRVESLMNITKSVGGEFVLLIHNDSLSEFAEWKGWRSSIIEILKKMHALNQA
ncbi:MAG: polysaccharide deacetylase family protein [Bacteroidia bacterium]